MSVTKTLADKFKAAPSVSDASGKSVMLTDSNGNVSKHGVNNLFSGSLYKAEPAETVLPLKDFIEKYVEDRPVGYMLTDKTYSNSARWYVNIKDNLVLNVQSFTVQIIKNYGRISSAWARVSLLFIPNALPTAYIVTYTTNSTASDVSVIVRRLELTTV